MSKTYQEFKDWIITFLWKEGDQVVLDNLDDLIRMAESELRRDLRVEERHRQLTFTTQYLQTDLPSDYHAMRTLATPDIHLPPFRYITPDDMVALTRNMQANVWRPFYSILDKKLMLCGPLAPEGGDVTDIEPATLTLDYTAKPGDYQTNGLSAIEDEYFDLFTYTVLKHCSPFIREDERTVLWDQKYGVAMDSALYDSKFYKERGISGPKPLPRQAGISRHSRRRFPYSPYLGNSGNTGGNP